MTTSILNSKISHSKCLNQKSKSLVVSTNQHNRLTNPKQSINQRRFFVQIVKKCDSKKSRTSLTVPGRGQKGQTYRDARQLSSRQPISTQANQGVGGARRSHVILALFRTPSGDSDGDSNRLRLVYVVKSPRKEDKATTWFVG